MCEAHKTANTLICLCLLVSYSRLDAEEHASNKATEAVLMYYQSETRYILRNVALHSISEGSFAAHVSAQSYYTCWKKRKRKKRQPSLSSFTFSKSRQDREFEVIKHDAQDFSFRVFSSLSYFSLSAAGCTGHEVCDAIIS